jgi:hypothetical protein
MKWTKPKHNQIRTLNNFLWFPVNINGDARWLQMSKRKQMYDLEIGWIDWLWVM